MPDEQVLKQTQRVYDDLSAVIKAGPWAYSENAENFEIGFGTVGNDLQIPICVRVDPERLIVTVQSPLPFSIPEDKRAEIAVAVSIINCMLVDGSFDYNFMDGSLTFRITSSYCESLLGKGALEYMLYVSCKTTDDYNDTLFMIAQDKMTIEDLIRFIQEREE